MVTSATHSARGSVVRFVRAIRALSADQIAPSIAQSNDTFSPPPCIAASMSAVCEAVAVCACLARRSSWVVVSGR